MTTEQAASMLELLQRIFELLAILVGFGAVGLLLGVFALGVWMVAHG